MLKRGHQCLLVLAVLCLCSLSAKLRAQEVYVSIPPLKYAAEKLLGTGTEVGVVLAPGQNPHSYSPTAKQISRLAQAKVLFTTGVPFEKLLLDRLQQIAPDLRIVETDAKLVKRTFSSEHEHVHGPECDHGDADPHVWLSPKLYSEQAIVMARVLAESYPDKKESIMKNLLVLNVQLTSLDVDLQASLAGFQGNTIMVYHPAFGYFCDAYGLKQVAVEMEGKEPSAAQLSRLIKTAQEKNIQTLFVQKQFPPATAQAIADAIEGTVIPLDPLSSDYVNNLRDLAGKMGGGKTE
jgi:zinc transport system substrate-binding protein